MTMYRSIAAFASATRIICVAGSSSARSAAFLSSPSALLQLDPTCTSIVGNVRTCPPASTNARFQAAAGGAAAAVAATGAEARCMSTSSSDSSDGVGKPAEFVKLADPAPGSPFHYAFPVHDLDAAKKFYGDVLGCAEGRSSPKWQDFSLNGHQIVCHWVGNDYRCQDYFNPVDGDEVPVPHTGLALTEDEFHALAERVRDAGVEFIIEPHLRFKGQPGEQWTMFFKDPSGNNLEFKAMTTIDNLFAKYNVVD
mmetsp:Transcript_30862/g.62587  ORF Transcript_30862/g.62587 Transcript_30862/m.62587 type:complete len:253 (-) Transcript_30862:191-949(-)